MLMNLIIFCLSWRVSGGGGGQLWLSLGSQKLVVETVGCVHPCELWQEADILGPWHPEEISEVKFLGHKICTFCSLVHMPSYPP